MKPQPEKATLARLRQFLGAWKARDPEEMLKHCSHTWIADGHPNTTALGWLEHQIIFLNLESYDIDDLEQRTGIAEFSYDVNVVVSGTPGKIIANVTREISAYRPSPKAGRYGVNPISIMAVRFGT